MISLMEYTGNRDSRRSSFAMFLFRDNLTLPLRSKFINGILGKRVARAGHFTNAEGIDRLKSLEGSKRSISAMSSDVSLTRFKTFLDDGVEIGGGFLALVEGNMLADFGKDIFSSADENGMRWINIDQIPRNNTKHNSFLSKLSTQLSRARDREYLQMYEVLIENQLINKENVYRRFRRDIENMSDMHKIEHFPDVMGPILYTKNSIAEKLLIEYILKMNKVVEKVLMKFKDIFQDILFHANDIVGEHNEIILNRIDVRYVIIEEMNLEDISTNFEEVYPPSMVSLVNSDDTSDLKYAYKIYRNWIERGKLP